MEEDCSCSCGVFLCDGLLIALLKDTVLTGVGLPAVFCAQSGVSRLKRIFQIIQYRFRFSSTESWAVGHRGEAPRWQAFGPMTTLNAPRPCQRTRRLAFVQPNVRATRSGNSMITRWFSAWAMRHATGPPTFLPLDGDRDRCETGPEALVGRSVPS